MINKYQDGLRYLFSNVEFQKAILHILQHLMEKDGILTFHTWQIDLFIQLAYEGIMLMKENLPKLLMPVVDCIFHDTSNSVPLEYRWAFDLLLTIEIR